MGTGVWTRMGRSPRGSWVCDLGNAASVYGGRSDRGGTVVSSDAHGVALVCVGCSGQRAAGEGAAGDPGGWRLGG